MGCHGRRGRARLPRHRRRLTCHFFSRVRDLRIPLVTCTNVGLTLSGAADTFRIAPSDRQVGRRDRTKRRPRKDGGDTGWKGRCGGLWKGREAARSLSREGSPRRGGSQDPSRQPDGEGRKVGPSGVRHLRARTGREVGSRTTGRSGGCKARPIEPQRWRRWHGRREAHRSPAVRTLSAQARTSPGALEPEGLHGGRTLRREITGGSSGSTMCGL